MNFRFFNWFKKQPSENECNTYGSDTTWWEAWPTQQHSIEISANDSIADISQKLPLLIRDFVGRDFILSVHVKEGPFPILEAEFGSTESRIVTHTLLS